MTKMASHLKNIRILSGTDRITAPCDMAIRDGKVSAILSCGSAPAAGAEVIDGRGAICMPGLINTHNHSPLMIVRGMVEDTNFAPAYTPGIPQGHWLSDEETLALARLGVLEMLMAGATTIVDYYRKPDALARAAQELGLRAMVGGRVMDANTAELAQGRFVHDRALGAATLRDAMDLIDRWEGKSDGRITTILAPHAPDTCSREMLQEFARLAASTGKQVHTHLAQSQMEVDHIRVREGMTPAELLDDVGLLNADLVAAHCIFLSDDDIARMGAARVVVAHAPIGNASFGAAAPIFALNDAGAQITLCTDTKSADMFEAMRTAISSARRLAGMKYVLDAKQVFTWATQAGARALRHPDATGLIVEGGPADLILLDPDAPNLCPLIDGHGTVVHSASAPNVMTVICDGEVLIRDRKPTRVDMAEIISEAQRVSEGLWARARA